MKAKSAFSLAILVLFLTPQLRGQEEVGRKERRKILIGWAKQESKNYSIQYEKVIPLTTVKQINDALEDVLTQYVLVFKYKPEEKLKVKFLDSMNTYEQEGGDPSHPGFFNGQFLVIKQMPFYDLVPIVYHEAFHQYIHYFMGKGVTIPTWFNEGSAMYFEGIQKNKGTKKLDYKMIENRKLRMVRDKVFTRSTIPLDKLVDATYEQFHEKENEDLHYNQSFGLIYFFMQGMGGKPVFDFASELKKTKDVKAATEKIFGKDRKNLKSIEAKWKEYLTKVTINEK